MLLTQLPVLFCGLFLVSHVQSGVLNNEIDQEFHSESAEKDENPKIPRGSNKCEISDKLAKEIAGYQPVVNKIVKEILSGKYKGQVWTR